LGKEKQEIRLAVFFELSQKVKNCSDRLYQFATIRLALLKPCTDIPNLFSCIKHQVVYTALKTFTRCLNAPRKRKEKKSLNTGRLLSFWIYQFK
jgi:hypothetical protein